MSLSRGDGPQPSGNQLWCCSPSLGCSSCWKCCMFYSSSLVLQTQQAWPGFSSPGWGSRWFHHAWLTCQLLSSEARPDWFSLPSPCSPFLLLHLSIAFVAGAGVWMWRRPWAGQARGAWRCAHWHLPPRNPKQRETGEEKEILSVEVAERNVRLLADRRHSPRYNVNTC